MMQTSDTITWDGIVVHRGEVHVETVDSWDQRRDAETAVQAATVATVCGSPAQVRDNRVLLVNYQDVSDAIQGLRHSNALGYVCAECRETVGRAEVSP